MGYEAVHQTILAVDIEGFGRLNRTNPILVKLRADLRRLLEGAFERESVNLSKCTIGDTGDGFFVLIPAIVPKTKVLDLVFYLECYLRERNDSVSEKNKMRLRAVVDAGEVVCDDNGSVAKDLNFAFRLLDCAPLRTALASTPAGLALIVSDRIYQDVVLHNAGLIPVEEYFEVKVSVKETTAKAWITVFSRGKATTDKGSPADSGPEQPRKVVPDGTTKEPGRQGGVRIHAGRDVKTRDVVGGDLTRRGRE